MLIGKVVGNLWSTKKDDKLNGNRFLIIRKMKNSEEVEEKIYVAADKVGAGIGELVLVTTGSNAKLTFDSQTLPIDMAIIGIIDSIDLSE
ncbi:EutN/CcmL family microcompartment protein [Ignavigranum ruoffiae]|uniref:Ethanolamine utilization protein EutN n=1 Tax=Ignavigranum ruoffiae TaxID=89093 RepID=A0A1H9CEE5_9LACT|nr:EutN/CcmL family microcompartment protein [Ignavigranum ruoffiae]SEP99377.1 ethanolamine utilization protein EutN [Ignavigranum ruoffiae]